MKPTSGGARRGRPPRSQAQREQAKQRRIPKSGKGRLKFIPGLPHVMDGEIQEARRLREQLLEELTQISKSIAALDQADDPGQEIGAEERALKQFLWQTYRDHKHRDHIPAVFLSLRRRRLITRLRAARVALEMASDLLEPDERILDELRAAVDYQQRVETIIASMRKPKAAALKVLGQDQDDIRVQLEAYEYQAREAASTIDHRHIYGDASDTKRQLERFDSQVRQMRGALTLGIGWFEQYYIYRIHLTREAKKYLARDEEIPPDVMKYEGMVYGPYLKYRWQEGGPEYTVQMGRIPAEKWSDAQEPEIEGDTPWPSL